MAKRNKPPKQSMPLDRSSIEDLESRIDALKAELQDQKSALEKSNEKISHLDSMKSKTIIWGVIFVIGTCLGYFMSNTIYMAQYSAHISANTTKIDDMKEYKSKIDQDHDLIIKFMAKNN